MRIIIMHRHLIRVSCTVRVRARYIFFIILAANHAHQRGTLNFSVTVVRIYEHAHFRRFIANLSNMENETSVEVELWLRVLHGTLGSLLLSCNFLCSCTVIVFVSFSKKLHYSSMVMSLGLVVADLVLAVTWFVQMMLYTIAGQWPLGDSGCIHVGLILVWMLYVRWCEVGVVTLDRFLTIVFPFYKYKKSHKRFLVAMTILAWAVPGLMVMPSAFGFGKQTFRPQVSACTVGCEGNKGCIAYYSALVLIFKVIGGALPFSLYTAMYCIGVRKRRKHRNRNLGSMLNVAENVSLPSKPDNTIRNRDTSNVADIEIRGSSLNAVTTAEDSERAASSNVTQQSSWPNFPNQQERNALTTVFIIFISMILTHIPIYSTSVMEHIGALYEQIPLIVHLSAVYIFLLGLFLDSIVIMRNKDFREVLVRRVRQLTARRRTNLTRNGSTTLSLFDLGSRRDLNQDNLQRE